MTKVFVKKENLLPACADQVFSGGYLRNTKTYLRPELDMKLYFTRLNTNSSI